MKITYCSDLHLECGYIQLDNTLGADVLILAGDILIADPLKRFPIDYVPQKTMKSAHYTASLTFRKFIAHVASQWLHVVVIAGNHEFFYGRYDEGLATLKKEYGRYPNVHFLENATCKIDDVIFVGATLWSDCNKMDPVAMHDVKNNMSDYKFIKIGTAYRKFSVVDSIKMHMNSLSYIESVVSANTNVVVVTHHSPSKISLPERFKNDCYSSAYYTSLEQFIQRHTSIKAWIHGHIHNNLQYKIFDSIIGVNAFGYPGEGMAFNMQLINL